MKKVIFKNKFILYLLFNLINYVLLFIKILSSCNSQMHKIIRESRDPQTMDGKIQALLKVMDYDCCEVVICDPGDIMIFGEGDYHAVITVYPLGTPIKEQVALICGKYLN